jgi:hypothetical protein
MRKLALVSIFTFCALLVGTFTAKAQWYITPTAGLNVSNIATNDATPLLTVSSLMQINGGLMIRKQVSKQFSVQSDVLFSQMGAKYTIESDPKVVTERSLNYVQVPVYVNYEIPFMPKNLVPYRVKTSSVSAHLMAGGFFGYGLDGSNDAFNAIDFGIAVGGGFSFKLDPDDKKRLIINARYLMGMSDHDKSDPVTSTNSAIQANVGLQFKLTNRRHIRYSR